MVELGSPMKSLTYAVEVKCDEPETRHWKHPWCDAKNNGELAGVPALLTAFDQPATIAGLFIASHKKYGSQKSMGTRPITGCLMEGKKKYWTKGPYEWKSYNEVYKTVTDAAMGLLKLPGIKEKRMSSECVAAILADTSADWHMCAQAAFQCGIPITTVYTTLGHEAMLHGLNETKTSILFLDFVQYDVLKTAVLEKCNFLEHIVLIGECFVPLSTTGGESAPFPAVDAAAALPVVGKAAKTTTLEALIAAGIAEPIDLTGLKPRPEDLAFIMYTSGSTGMPKGVMLTHANFVAVTAGIDAQGVIQPKPDDAYIAFLPLAHILELMVEVVCFKGGCPIGYGHAKTLTSSSPFVHPDNPGGSDLMAVLPTVLVAVPAILELIKNGLVQKLAKLPGLKGKLVRGAVNKKQGLAAGEGGCASCLLSLGLTNKLVGKVKAQLGLQNLRIIISGGAPLAAETGSYIAKVLAPVAQGYGATETMGASFIQEVFGIDGRPVDSTAGGVGCVIPCVEVKLKSVPDMGYLVTESPPRGEILLSGNTVSKGYFEMPDKTAEDFVKHDDGKVWFHTGDIGVITHTGALRIIDRKKDLVKLSGGEYVSLGKVEASLKQVPGIGQCCVFAKSDKDHCCVIVSQPERGWDSVGGRPEEAALLKAIESTLKKLAFSKFEIPSKAKVSDEIWTPETGLVTASMKLQRNPLRLSYNAPGGLLAQMDYQFPDSKA